MLLLPRCKTSCAYPHSPIQLVRLLVQRDTAIPGRLTSLAPSCLSSGATCHLSRPTSGDSAAAMKRRGDRCGPPDGAPGSSPSGSNSGPQRPSQTSEQRSLSACGSHATSPKASPVGAGRRQELAQVTDGVRRRDLVTKFAIMTVLFILSAWGLISFYRHLPGNGRNHTQLWLQAVPPSKL